MKASLSLERTDLLGLRALLALSGRELDPLVLLEVAETIGHDGGVVHEDVGASVIWCDESVTLARVEPLNGALRHVLLLISDLRDRITGPGLRDRLPTPGGSASGGCQDARCLVSQAL